jgi:hypothetical protein
MKRARASWLFAAVLAAILCGFNPAHATDVYGQIAANTTWLATNSPYIVTGSILVNTGVTLTIEPGVTVKFNTAKAIQVDGKLVARGTAGSRIIFTSSATVVNKGDWSYIKVTSSGVKTSFDGTGTYLDGTIFEYCTIEYGGGSGAQGMLWADTAGLYVNYCTIQNSGVHGLLTQTSGNLMVSNCEIKNNSSDGINAAGGVDGVIIKNNTVSLNTSVGVNCSGNNVDISTNTVTGNNFSGLYCSGKNVNILNNTITDNGVGAYTSHAGIYLAAAGDGTSTITGNTITGNSGYHTGGIYASQVNLVAGNTISGNSGIGNTGGIYASGVNSIESNTISDNTAGSYGGGIYCGTATTAISYNTINNNIATGGGGGFYGTGLIANNCFSNNSSGTQHGNALTITDSNATVNNNTILQTGITGDALNYGLAMGSPNLDATSNYWGTTVDAEVQSLIYDWFDDGSKAIVNYTPFLTAAAICSLTSTTTTTVTTSTTSISTGGNARAIIVAGSGPYTGNNLWDITKKLAQQAYNGLLYQGFSDEKIYYLTFDEYADPDNDSSVDYDGTPDNATLKYAITDWAADADSLVIYMMGHGMPGYYEINGYDPEMLSGETFGQWLDTAQASIDGPVIVIYEACYAGSFVPLLVPAPALAGKTRIVIASTGTTEKAWFDVNGMISFSRYFWMGVTDGNNVATCYSLARQCMAKPGYQHAQLDADGDAIPDQLADLSKAALYKIGKGMVSAPVYPVVGTVMPEARLYSSVEANEIWATDITPVGADLIQLVWAVIKRPAAGGAGGGRAVVDPPYEILLDTDKDGKWTGEYDNFTTPGVYTIAVYARDNLTNVSEPKVIKVIKDIDAYEEDDVKDDATPIVVNYGATQYHNFWDTDDVDWVKFYGMAGEIYAITVTDEGPQCDAVIELYDAAGTLLDQQTSGLLSWNCTADGLYYVKVYQGNTGVYGIETNYELKVYNPAAPVLGMIKGSITDGSSGSPVPNPVITTDGGYSAVGGSTGYYEMPHKGGGPYTLTAAAAGYQTYTQAGINLGTTEVLQINIVMTPGEDTTTTTSVSTTTTSVSTTTTSVSTTTTASDTTTTIVPGDNTTTTTTTVSGGRTTTTTTVRRWCPLRRALGDGSEAELGALRQFRDARLAKSAKGARLVGLYYRHAEELTLMLERRPDIAAQVRELVLELLPQIGGQNKLVLKQDMKQQLFDLIEQIRTDASPGLKKSLRLVRKIIEKGDLELK